jgi:hypothetical protein
MLVQRGKVEGWLHLDVAQTQEWARMSGISFSAASATSISGRGIGLTADRDLTAFAEVLSVPEDLVLSVDTIKQHAQFDSDFRELFDSLGASATVGVLYFLSQAFKLASHFNSFIANRSESVDRLKCFSWPLLCRDGCKSRSADVRYTSKFTPARRDASACNGIVCDAGARLSQRCGTELISWAVASHGYSLLSSFSSYYLVSRSCGKGGRSFTIHQVCQDPFALSCDPT